MSKRLISLLVMSAAFSGAVALAPAQAADRDFCRNYTDAAMRQFHEAQDHRRCHDLLRNETRWHGDREAHFKWCLGASVEEASRERDARTHALNDCARD